MKIDLWDILHVKNVTSHLNLIENEAIEIYHVLLENQWNSDVWEKFNLKNFQLKISKLKFNMKISPTGRLYVT